jgi:hypothetical protein
MEVFGTDQAGKEWRLGILEAGDSFGACQHGAKFY